MSAPSPFTVRRETRGPAGPAPGSKTWAIRDHEGRLVHFEQTKAKAEAWIARYAR